MIDLGEYFSYNDENSNISNVFEELSRQLKIIHSHNMVVPYLNSKTISCEDDFRFTGMDEPYNFELQKRENIRSLAKLMLGTYLSAGTGFKDFSSVDDEWFSDNIEDISKSITADNYYSEYFENIFVNGSEDYYSDFVDKKRQDADLNKKSNLNGFKKVLRNAASNLYEEEDEYQVEDVKKNASINSIFYPLLIGSLLLITLLISLLIKINH